MARETLTDPWQIPYIGASDQLAVRSMDPEKWCHICLYRNFYCNRPVGHTGHHVGSTPRDNYTVHYFQLVLNEDMALPEGF